MKISQQNPQVIAAVVVAIVLFIATASLIGAQNKLLRERQAETPTPTPTSRPLPTNTPKPFPTGRPARPYVFPTAKPLPTNTPYPTWTPFPTRKPLPTLEPMVNCELSYGTFNLFESVCLRAKQRDDSYRPQPTTTYDAYEPLPAPDFTYENTTCKQEALETYNREKARVTSLFAGLGTIDSSAYETEMQRLNEEFVQALNTCDYYYPVSD